MSFTNTVEALGDAVLTNSIIDRSITELHDDIITAIGRGALHGCSALKNVNFKGVTEIGENAFESCTSLKRAEFHNTVNEIKASAFYDCTSLEALILRGQKGTVVSGAFNSSAIVAGTGYIYVPASLLAEYKADAVWGTVQSQIRAIEDWPEVCDPYSWEVVFKCIDAGTYKDVYKVGDLVPLDLGTEGVVNMQIAAFDVDDLADGSGKAPITWISKELLETSHRYNPELATNDDGTYQEGTGAIGGWEKSELRAYLYGTITTLIPANVLDAIKPVIKYSLSTDSTGNSVYNKETSDSIWVPGHREVYASGSMLVTKGPAYNPELNVAEDFLKKKTLAGLDVAWFLREVFSNESCYYVTNGKSSTGISTNKRFICLCFCT